MHYNEKLANQQGLSQEEREALDLTYDLLHDVLKYPERYPNVESTVRGLEYRLQKEWKFPQDPKFHRYQLEIKDCTCPKLDNWELIGHTTDRYRVSSCPWHWKPEDDDKLQKARDDRQKLIEEWRNEL